MVTLNDLCDCALADVTPSRAHEDMSSRDWGPMGDDEDIPLRRLEDVRDRLFHSLQEITITTNNYLL